MLFQFQLTLALSKFADFGYWKLIMTSSNWVGVEEERLQGRIQMHSFLYGVHFVFNHIKVYVFSVSHGRMVIHCCIKPFNRRNTYLCLFRVVLLFVGLMVSWSRCFVLRFYSWPRSKVVLYFFWKQCILLLL